MKISDEELQYKLIYSIVVAGKSAKFTENVMRKLLPKGWMVGIFKLIWEWDRTGVLEEKLREAKTGNYTKLAGAMRDLMWIKFSLRDCTPQQLETVHGIGPKTSRFFIMWTRPDEGLAALDVHVLRWLRNNGYPDAPTSTPQNLDTYEKWEDIFVKEALKRNKTAREFDHEIWMAGSKYTGELQAA